MTSFFVGLLTVLVIVALVWLILYLFNRVMPNVIDANVINIILVIVLAILIIMWITGHGIYLWKP